MKAKCVIGMGVIPHVLNAEIQVRAKSGQTSSHSQHQKKRRRHKSASFPASSSSIRVAFLKTKMGSCNWESILPAQVFQIQSESQVKIARNTKAGKKCPKKGSKILILATAVAFWRWYPCSVGHRAPWVMWKLPFPWPLLLSDLDLGK